jgi:hypothetical protein
VHFLTDAEREEYKKHEADNVPDGLERFFETEVAALGDIGNKSVKEVQYKKYKYNEQEIVYRTEKTCKQGDKEYPYSFEQGRYCFQQLIDKED